MLPIRHIAQLSSRIGEHHALHSVKSLDTLSWPYQACQVRQQCLDIQRGEGVRAVFTIHQGIIVARLWW